MEGYTNVNNYIIESQYSPTMITLPLKGAFI